jgi:hypothetical protein
MTKVAIMRYPPYDACSNQTYMTGLNYVQANDASGYVVTGYNEDIELLVRLVEQFDRPQRQVLIEVYMINVVKDFNRKLDLTFQTDALASNTSQTGGFFLRRDLTDLSQSVTSQTPGGFVSGLISPNNQVEALVDFIETNNLGQTDFQPYDTGRGRRFSFGDAHKHQTSDTHQPANLAG